MTRKERTDLKHARELLKGARKILRIERDILDPRRAQEVVASCDSLETAIANRDAASAASLGEKLLKQLDRTIAPRDYAGVRENVEVLLVAAIVAMAVRSFFIQPFKIPTGSMQPTLYGIVDQQSCNTDEWFGKRLGYALFRGRWPTAERGRPGAGLMDFVGWIAFGKWPDGAKCRMRGDHIFVDRFTYHFRKPTRGEVIVFDTKDVVELPEPVRGRFYIKRLVGIGGDVVQILPPHVLINGAVLDERPAFRRIYSRKDGYSGYVIPSPDINPPARFIRSVNDRYKVPEDHLFVLGDNSNHSADGRFWGSVPKRGLIGRAFMVYWPFSKRFGPID